MTNLSHIFASLFGNNISANIILKTLKEFDLGVRRQDFLSEIRKVRNIEIDEEKAKALYTRVKFLTEKQKEKKYLLLYDKMRDKAYRREQREKRKITREFIQNSDLVDEDTTLIPSEKMEDAFGEMKKYVKYELYELIEK